MNRLLGFIRLLAFAIVTLLCITGYLLLAPMHRFSLHSGYRMRQIFIHIMLAVLNVRIRLYGKVPENFHGILVANHRSYFDPVAILHYTDAVTVAKAEVSKWPLVGLGSRLVGVIWVKREQKESRQAARNKIAGVVREGHNVLIFPEGTSSTSATMLELRNATFVIAAENGIPILPVAIEYGYEADAWVGDDTFVRHFLQCFGKWRTDVGLYFLPSAANQQPEQLKSEVVRAIDNSIAVLRNELKYQK